MECEKLMEICDVMEEGLRRARDVAMRSAQAFEKGDRNLGLELAVTSNGLMLSVICHGLFAHSDEDEGLWKELFVGTDQTDD